MSFSDYWEDATLNHLFNKAVYTAPTIYVGLSSTAPADDGTGVTEPSGGGYARVATASTDWNSASGGQITNANDITFPQATADWGTMSYIVLYDAASAGNLLAYAALTTAKTVQNGDTAQFAAGDITITLD